MLAHQDGRALGACAPALRGDKELVLTAVATFGEALGLALEDVLDEEGGGLGLRGDKEVVLRAVAQSGEALYHASEALRGDKEVVLAAVAQSGLALVHASEELRADRDVVMAAAAQAGPGAVLWLATSRELQDELQGLFARPGS